MSLRVVIPSRGRFNVCKRAVALFSDPVLCVSESEADNYRHANPGTKLLVHPDSLPGITAKRQWILDHCEEETIFQCDDDVFRCMCLVGYRSRAMDQQSIMKILDNSRGIAMDIGTPLFGFSQLKDIRQFLPWRPFYLGGYVVGAAMGIIGREIRFDPGFVTKQDIDFSLQVLLKKRILFKDQRFCFESDDCFKATGGMASVRTTDVIEQDLKRLKQKWGDAVEVSHSDRGYKKHQNVQIHVQR